MTQSGRRDWRGIGCAALLGAAIAFPAGIIVGGNEPSRENAEAPSDRSPSATQTRPRRNTYSPRIASDPYVIEQQRRVLEALEVSCRQSNSYCAEAEQARLRIEEAEAQR